MQWFELSFQKLAAAISPVRYPIVFTVSESRIVIDLFANFHIGKNRKHCTLPA